MTMSRRLGVAGVVLAAVATMALGLGTGPARASGTAVTPVAVTTTAPPYLCRDCMTVNDAICWELPPFSCGVPVFIGWVAKEDVVVHYTTVDRTAVAGVDYVPVKDGLVTIPAGSQVGTGVVELIPGKPLDQDRTFLVELSDPSQGKLVRTVATVTIAAGQPEQTPPQK